MRSRHKGDSPSAGNNGGTAALLFEQATTFLAPRNFERPTAKNTTDANLGRDAVAVHRRLIERLLIRRGTP